MRKKSTLGLCNIIRILCITTCAVFIIGTHDAMASTGCSHNTVNTVTHSSSDQCSKDKNGETGYMDLTGQTSFACITGDCHYAIGDSTNPAKLSWYSCKTCGTGYYRKNLSQVNENVGAICDMDDGPDLNAYNCVPCPSNSVAPANNSYTQCTTCTGGTKPNSDSSQCVSDCSTSRACSEWSNVYTQGTYNECSGEDPKEHCYKTCTKTCSGEAKCPDHATCEYDTSVSTNGKEYTEKSCDAENPGTCPVKKFICNEGYHKNGDKCDEDAPTKCKNGEYLSDNKCNSCGTAEGVYSDNKKTPASYTSDGTKAKSRSDCYLEKNTEYYTDKGKFTYSDTCNAQDE